MTKLSPRRILCGMLAASSLAFGLACGDDEETREGLEVGDPQFALALFIVDANFESITYILFTDNLDSGTLDLSNALEVGQGSMHGLPGEREFFVSSRERGDLTKYQVRDGFVEEAGRVLLSGAGLQLFGEQLVFEGPDRGFVLELLSGRIVEINLESMEIVRTIDASALLDPVQPTFLTASEQVRRDNEVIFATYGTDLEQETVSDLSRIVFFDPTTGTFEAKTAPCGGLSMIHQQANGDVYFFSDPWVAGVHGISATSGPGPCMARLPAGSRDPDPTPVMLNSLTGRPTGGVVPASGTSAYLRVLDTNTFPINNETSAIQLFGLRGWEVYEIDLTLPTSASPVGRETLMTGGTTYFNVDGTVYENQSADDFSSTVLLRTTGPGAPAAALQTPGVVIRILRLR